VSDGESKDGHNHKASKLSSESVSFSAHSHAMGVHTSGGMYARRELGRERGLAALECVFVSRVCSDLLLQ